MPAVLALLSRLFSGCELRPSRKFWRHFLMKPPRNFPVGKKQSRKRVTMSFNATVNIIKVMRVYPLKNQYTRCLVLLGGR
jgi:hypothetical protein